MALLVGEEILRISRHGRHRGVHPLAVLLHDAIDLTVVAPRLRGVVGPGVVTKQFPKGMTQR